MKLVVGLGNPGERYKKTRHNVGFMVIEKLYEKVLDYGFKPLKKFDAEIVLVNDCVFAKPLTFMNNSGRAVKRMVDFYKIKMDDLWVIHDDLDINLGEYKKQKGVGPKVHNGVNSVEEMLGRKNFWRVRVGVENRGGERVRGEEYVLANFEKKEGEQIGEVVCKLVEEGINNFGWVKLE